LEARSMPGWLLETSLTDALAIFCSLCRRIIPAQAIIHPQGIGSVMRDV
jgi:hypothetical protein